MSGKVKQIKSSPTDETECSENEMDQILENEFMPLAASYVDENLRLEIRYLDGKKPCKGLSVDEVKNATGQLFRFYETRKDWVGEGEALLQLNAALAAFSRMDPGDSVEAMMISQMIVIQEMTMVMAERTLVTGQSSEYIDRCTNRVTKLSRTYASLAEALTKYRTKGRQRITVQHVTVSDGGQAVIGDVNQGGG